MSRCEAEMCPMWNGDTCVCAAIYGDPEAIADLTEWINDFPLVTEDGTT
jgi:hypothetical protein